MENQTPERRQRVLSAIQPTAIPTLGNYLGALRNWKATTMTASTPLPTCTR